MRFIRIPTQTIKTKELGEAERLGTEPDYEEGVAIINIDHISQIIEGENSCSIFFSSGDSLYCALNIDEMAIILDSK